MNLFTVILIAFSLACDSFAVSICCGVNCKYKITGKEIIKTALFFGIFQGIMFFLGFFIGNHVLQFILNFNHYVALLILVFLGSKMIYEALSNKSNESDEEMTKTKDPFSIKNLTLLGIATSLDALAVGFSLIGILKEIYFEASIVAIVSFVLSIFGVIIGKKIGHYLENKFEILGGLILIGIGLKIFIEHYM